VYKLVQMAASVHWDQWSTGIVGSCSVVVAVAIAVVVVVAVHSTVVVVVAVVGVVSYGLTTCVSFPHKWD